MKYVLAAAALAVATLSGCGSSEPDAASWEQIQEAACAESGLAVIDQAAYAADQLEAEGYGNVVDSVAPVKEADGLVEERSCSGQPPFINRYKSATAAQIWLKDFWIAEGCLDPVVAADDWIVSSIKDTDTADRLVKLGGELVDC